MEVLIQLSKDATLPKKGTNYSAGYDLYADVGGVIPAHEKRLIGTGIRIEMPPNHYGEIRGRSGLALNHGISVMAGIIDNDYTGEIMVLLHNTSYANFGYQKGEKIAQLIFHEMVSVHFKLTDTIKSTDEEIRDLDLLVSNIKMYV